jgi:hypothetical protein
MNKITTYLVLLLGSPGLLAPAAPSLAQGPDAEATSREAPPTSPLAGWSRLELSGRKFLIARGASTIERWPGRELVAVTSEVSALGIRREHRVWVVAADPEGAAPRWAEVSPESKVRVVRYLAGEGAVEARRHRWRDEELGWGPERVQRFPLPAEAACSGRPRDAWSMLAELDDLVRIRPAERLVLTRKGVDRLRVVPGRARELTWKLEDLDRGETRRVRLRAAEVHLRGAEKGETILGMSGDTTLLIDPVSGALLEIRGERDGVPGTIRLSLDAVGFAPRALPAADPTRAPAAREGSLDADAGIP